MNTGAANGFSFNAGGWDGSAASVVTSLPVIASHELSQAGDTDAGAGTLALAVSASFSQAANTHTTEIVTYVGIVVSASQAGDTEAGAGTISLVADGDSGHTDQTVSAVSIAIAAEHPVYTQEANTVLAAGNPIAGLESATTQDANTHVTEIVTYVGVVVSASQAANTETSAGAVALAAAGAASTGQSALGDGTLLLAGAAAGSQANTVTSRFRRDLTAHAASTGLTSEMH